MAPINWQQQAANQRGAAHQIKSDKSDRSDMSDQAPHQTLLQNQTVSQTEGLFFGKKDLSSKRLSPSPNGLNFFYRPLSGTALKKNDDPTPFLILNP